MLACEDLRGHGKIPRTLKEPLYHFSHLPQQEMPSLKDRFFKSRQLTGFLFGVYRLMHLVLML